MIDGRPYFVAGYTAGGAAYGIYLDEMDDGYLTEMINPRQTRQAIRPGSIRPVSTDNARCSHGGRMRAVRGSADALGQRDDYPFRPPDVGHPPSALVLADATDQSVALG